MNYTMRQMAIIKRADYNGYFGFVQQMQGGGMGGITYEQMAHLDSLRQQAEEFEKLADKEDSAKSNVEKSND